MKKSSSEFLNKISSVKCEGCGSIFLDTTEDFFVIYGNITIGVGGGLIGNNFNDEWSLLKSSVYCHKCFADIFAKFYQKKFYE